MWMLDKLFARKSGGTKILTSADLANELGVGYATDAGIPVTPETAMRFGTVFGCVRVISEGIGMLPLHLFEQKGRDRLPAKGHPLHRVLAIAPNDFQTAQEYWEMVGLHLALRGNHYSLINRVGGQVRELLPLSPNAVTPVQDDGYGVTYKVQFQGGGQKTLPATDVLHIKLLSNDGLTGLSPVSHARQSIGLGLATQQHGSRLFKNGARPSGILSTEQALTKEQIESYGRNWRENYGGGNTGGTAVLGGGLKYATVTMTSEDAQFLETRKFQRSEIAGIFRVPLHMINDLERATFSNIEHLSQEFVTFTLMPYLTRIEHRVRASLLGREEQASLFAKFNANALLRGDMKTRAEFYTKMVQNGALSPNEIRELEDLNPREGGDIYLTPINMAINGAATGKEESKDAT